MDLSKLNGSTFDRVFDDVENINDYVFIKKEQALNSEYLVKSLYLTKGDFDYQTNFILVDVVNAVKCRISFNGRDLFDTIINDIEIVNAIKADKISLQVISYENKKYKKTCYKPHFTCK